jgi:hydroxyacylglutathione hydrolase
MEVVKGIHEFSGVSNCYLVEENGIFLVDTGMPGNSSKIIKYLERNLKHESEDIETIVVTHHHFDHIGSLDRLKMITKAKIAVHSADAPYLSGEKTQTGSALMKPMIKIMKYIYNTHPVKADILLEEGDQINGYQVIHTPGHTPGSICLYNPDEKVLFVGDNLHYSKGKLEKPKIMHEPEKFKESIKKLGNLDIEVILTGHGKPVKFNANTMLKEFLDDNI